MAVEELKYTIKVDDLYYVWSNEHRAWWAPGRRGYSRGILGAGTYSREQALLICRDAIPTSLRLGTVSEVPIRKIDVEDFLRGQLLPPCILEG